MFEGKILVRTISNLDPWGIEFHWPASAEANGPLAGPESSTVPVYTRRIPLFSFAALREEIRNLLGGDGRRIVI